jgi:hypothetical protein
MEKISVWWAWVERKWKPIGIAITVVGIVSWLTVYFARAVFWFELFAPLSYFFLVLLALLIVAAASAFVAVTWFKVFPRPIPNLLTADDVRQIIKEEIESDRAAEKARIEALPHDFEADNVRRRTMAATNYIIGLAEARMGRRLTAFLGQSKAVLDAHRHDVSSINVQMTMKGFDRPLRNLDHELRVLGVNLEDIQEKAKALQLEVASNPQMLIVREGEDWPSGETKRDWHMRLAIWDAYKQAVESLALRQNTTLLDVVVNAKPLGGNNEQQR